jgi:cytochrome bd-type quinol oxidase subunit 2
MITKLKKVFLTAAAIAAVATPALVPAAASAADNISNGLCAGSNFDVNQTSGCTVNSAQASKKVNDILTLIINIFSLVVGVVSVIMIIVGGLKYITSGGEASNISGAKNTIIYAIVGLVIVALAQFIVHFVLGKVTSTA